MRKQWLGGSRKLGGFRKSRNLMVAAREDSCQKRSGKQRRVWKESCCGLYNERSVGGLPNSLDSEGRALFTHAILQRAFRLYVQLPMGEMCSHFPESPCNSEDYWLERSRIWASRIVDILVQVCCV